MFKVRATETGYYGIERRRPGKVFDIEKVSHFSEEWMEWVDAPPPGWKPKGKRGTMEQAEIAARKPQQQPHGIFAPNTQGSKSDPAAFSQLQKKGKTSSDADVI